MRKQTGLPKTLAATSEDVQAALGRISSSTAFAQATRLREFLAYVVNKALTDQSDLISGRTIAQDVYQRGHGENDSDLTVVRVDAGRLRRRLAEYYAKSGANDTIRVTIPTGSYTPVFERLEPTKSAASPQVEPSGLSGLKPALILALACALAVVGFILYQNLYPTDLNAQTQAEQEMKSATRLALLQKSPATLQAVNQAEQARSLMFPAPDPARIQFVLGMFEHVIDLDGGFFGGYAGAAQAAGILGLMAPEGPVKSAMLAKAGMYADKAIALRPDSSWTQSSAAWVAFANGDFENAIRLSDIAVSLDPKDLYAREICSLIALFSGDFERAVEMGDPGSFVADTTGRKTNRNVFGIAHFYLGNYQTTVEQLEEVIQSGEPISEISVFYLVAAHQKLGNYGDAQSFLRYYQTAWPDNRIGQLLKRVFVSPDYLDAPIALVRAAGGLTGN